MHPAFETLFYFHIDGFASTSTHPSFPSDPITVIGTGRSRGWHGYGRFFRICPGSAYDTQKGFPPCVAVQTCSL